MRLNKFLAERTGISRRAADQAIQQGRVLVNDKTADLGAQITASDRVKYDGKYITHDIFHTTIMLNKPVGYLSSRRSQGGNPTVYDLLPTKYRGLKTAGRLDRDSSGLIILTSDGNLTQKLTHPSNHKVKIYEVILNKPLKPLHRQMISDFGIDLPDGKSRFTLEEIEKSSDPDRAVWVARRRGTPKQCFAQQKFLGEEFETGPKHPEDELDLLNSTDYHNKVWRVTMHEGRNRQIRRTFAALGYKVIGLHRCQIGPYKLGNLKSGDYREIKP